jgi:hypothetical protein
MHINTDKNRENNRDNNNNSTNEVIKSISSKDKSKQIHINNAPISENSVSNISNIRYKKVNKNKVSLSASKLDGISQLNTNQTDTNISHNSDNIIYKEANNDKIDNENIDTNININTINNLIPTPNDNDSNIFDDKIKDNKNLSNSNSNFIPEATIKTNNSESVTTSLPIINVDNVNTNIEGIIEDSNQDIIASSSINDTEINSKEKNDEITIEINNETVGDKIAVLLETDVTINESNNFNLIEKINNIYYNNNTNNQDNSNIIETQIIEQIEKNIIIKTDIKIDELINSNNLKDNICDAIKEERIPVINIKSDISKFMSELEPPPKEGLISDTCNNKLNNNNNKLNNRYLSTKSSPTKKNIDKTISKNIENKKMSKVNNVAKISPRSHAKMINNNDLHNVKKTSLIDNKRVQSPHINKKITKVELNKKK